jgi:hypothetical protein
MDRLNPMHADSSRILSEQRDLLARSANSLREVILRDVERLTTVEAQIATLDGLLAQKVQP